VSDQHYIVLAHGGAGSDDAHADGTEAACARGLEALRSGQSVLTAAVETVVVLEDDSRFNAGIGSRRRADGSVQMDASVMDSDRRFGAVAVVEGFRNPVKIAEALTESDTHVLAGAGARQYALAQGIPEFDFSAVDSPQSGGTDTVGCVVYDGEKFAAGLSTGGTGGSLAGRVGDVPLLGCGLYAGPYGAVVATGKGEAISLNMTAFRAYQMLEEGMGPNFVLDEVLDWFDDAEDIGLLLVNRKDSAGGSNRSMAWSRLTA
jgi:isoaspartyl peptidase/L-asparaginase-like protein (Ntn-hydrolase superfamily)